MAILNQSAYWMQWPENRLKVASLILLLTLSACDPFSGSKQQATSTTAEKTRISFWNGFTGPDGQTMWEIVRQFEADYPQYEVEMEIIPWRDRKSVV